MGHAWEAREILLVVYIAIEGFHVTSQTRYVMRSAKLNYRWQCALYANMVNFCAVYGCGSRGDRDKKSFFRIPAVIKNQGERTLQLSTSCREKWLAALHREDLKRDNCAYYRVCADHFSKGKE